MGIIASDPKQAPQPPTNAAVTLKFRFSKKRAVGIVWKIRPRGVYTPVDKVNALLLCMGLKKEYKCGTNGAGAIKWRVRRAMKVIE